jgi:hypothetical protein
MRRCDLVSPTVNVTITDISATLTYSGFVDNTFNAGRPLLLYSSTNQSTTGYSSTEVTGTASYSLGGLTGGTQPYYFYIQKGYIRSPMITALTANNPTVSNITSSTAAINYSISTYYGVSVYGSTLYYGTTSYAAISGLSGTITLTGLTSNTLYYYYTKILYSYNVIQQSNTINNFTTSTAITIYTITGAESGAYDLIKDVSNICFLTPDIPYTLTFSNIDPSKTYNFLIVGPGGYGGSKNGGGGGGVIFGECNFSPNTPYTIFVGNSTTDNNSKSYIMSSDLSYTAYSGYTAVDVSMRGDGGYSISNNFISNNIIFYHNGGKGGYIDTEGNEYISEGILSSPSFKRDNYHDYFNIFFSGGGGMVGNESYGGGGGCGYNGYAGGGAGITGGGGGAVSEGNTSSGGVSANQYFTDSYLFNETIHSSINYSSTTYYSYTNYNGIDGVIGSGGAGGSTVGCQSIWVAGQKGGSGGANTGGGGGGANTTGAPGGAGGSGVVIIWWVNNVII